MIADQCMVFVVIGRCCCMQSEGRLYWQESRFRRSVGSYPSNGSKSGQCRAGVSAQVFTVFPQTNLRVTHFSIRAFVGNRQKKLRVSTVAEEDQVCFWIFGFLDFAFRFFYFEFHIFPLSYFGFWSVCWALILPHLHACH